MLLYLYLPPERTSTQKVFLLFCRDAAIAQTPRAARTHGPQTELLSISLSAHLYSIWLWLHFCYFSSSIYFAFVKSHNHDEPMQSFSGFGEQNKNAQQKKNFFNANKFHSFFHLLAAIYYWDERNGSKKKKNVKKCAREWEISTRNICMKKSATVDDDDDDDGKFIYHRSARTSSLPLLIWVAALLICYK